mmetsp:Transcript_17931/g.41477  ORF Transcript_17931/g.41477 Transcript_17931/m.41477 type:complete len:103 (-) Transcript_17931:1261-1569(-)
MTLPLEGKRVRCRRVHLDRGPHDMFDHVSYIMSWSLELAHTVLGHGSCRAMVVEIHRSFSPQAILVWLSSKNAHVWGPWLVPLPTHEKALNGQASAKDRAPF